jgi:uncharacterized membrane protein YhaH (DUF805 family)
VNVEDGSQVERGILRPRGPIVRSLAILGIVVGLSSVVAHALEYRGPERYSKDFAIDYSSALALRQGEDPYRPIKELVNRYLRPPPAVVRDNVVPGGNWHPPFKIITTVPFTYIPFRAAGVIWELISALCIVLAVALFGRTLGWSKRIAVTAGIAACALPVAQIDLSAGQLGGPILLVLVLMWRTVRRGSEVRAGAWLGLGAAIKFFPAFMALPILGGRRRRAVAVAAVTTIALSGAGLLIAGTPSAGGQLSALRNEGFSYWETSPANLSWWGLATRWLEGNGWVRGADVGALAQAAAFLGAAFFAVLALRPNPGATGERFWAATPLMLLAWPIVWDHYLILMVPWVVLSVRRAIDSGRAGRLAIVGVISVLLMLGLPPGMPDIGRASTLHVALGYQLPTYSLLAAVAIGFATHREPV